MDILKDKTYKTFDYTSRYANVPYYFNTQDNKYMHGLTKQLSTETQYTIHMVTDTDTVDKLSFKYYGRPDLYWIICDFNRIQNPYINLSEKYNFVYIPSLSGVKFN